MRDPFRPDLVGVLLLLAVAGHAHTSRLVNDVSVAQGQQAGRQQIVTGREDGPEQNFSRRLLQQNASRPAPPPMNPPPAFAPPRPPTATTVVTECDPVPAGFDFAEGMSWDGATTDVCYGMGGSYWTVAWLAGRCAQAPACKAFTVNAYGACLRTNFATMYRQWHGVPCYGTYVKKDCPTYAGYFLRRGYESLGGDLSTAVTLDAAALTCSSDAGCLGFNTDKQLKGNLSALKIDAHFQIVCEGTYVKDNSTQPPSTPPSPPLSPSQPSLPAPTPASVEASWFPSGIYRDTALPASAFDACVRSPGNLLTCETSISNGFAKTTGAIVGPALHMFGLIGQWEWQTNRIFWSSGAYWTWSSTAGCRAYEGYSFRPGYNSLASDLSTAVSHNAAAAACSADPACYAFNTDMELKGSVDAFALDVTFNESCSGVYVKNSGAPSPPYPSLPLTSTPPPAILSPATTCPLSEGYRFWQGLTVDPAATFNTVLAGGFDATAAACDEVPVCAGFDSSTIIALSFNSSRNSSLPICTGAYLKKQDCHVPNGFMLYENLVPSDLSVGGCTSTANAAAATAASFLSSQAAACASQPSCTGFEIDAGGACLQTGEGPLLPMPMLLPCFGYYAKQDLALSQLSPPVVPQSPGPHNAEPTPPGPSAVHPPFPFSMASPSGGFPGWAIGVIVGVVVAALLAAALVTLLLMRRSRQRRRGGAGGGKNHSVGTHRSTPDGAVVIALGSDLDHEASSLPSAFGQAAWTPCVKSDVVLSVTDSFEQPPSLDGILLDVARLRAAGPDKAPLFVSPEALKADMLTKSWRLKDEQLEVFEVLGRGGGGTVYRGLWKGLPVAAKMSILHEDFEEEAQRQIMEATMSTVLCHQNIVNTYLFDLRSFDSTVSPLDTGAAPSWRAQSILSKTWQLVILQELCTGGTLRQLMSNGALSLRSGDEAEQAKKLAHILQVACDVATGLEHLHSKDIVHSDLTPSNVLLQAAGPFARPSGLPWVAKVADFGLSIAFEPGRTHASQVYAGTPHYIAPETQAAGILSKQSDIFTFGLLLYEMAAGSTDVLKTHTIAGLGSDEDDSGGDVRMMPHVAGGSDEAGSGGDIRTMPLTHVANGGAHDTAAADSSAVSAIQSGGDIEASPFAADAVGQIVDGTNAVESSPIPSNFLGAGGASMPLSSSPAAPPLPGDTSNGARRLHDGGPSEDAVSSGTQGAAAASTGEGTASATVTIDNADSATVVSGGSGSGRERTDESGFAASAAAGGNTAGGAKLGGTSDRVSGGQAAGGPTLDGHSGLKQTAELGGTASSVSGTNAHGAPLLGGGNSSDLHVNVLPALPRACPAEYRALVRDCLSQIPAQRPSIASVRQCLVMLLNVHAFREAE